MNELKKHFNENVFHQNPFNDQVKQRMIKNVLNSNGLTKRKKNGPLIALISAACIILFFAITALEAPGLFHLGTSASQLQELQKEHPEMKRQLDKLSPEFRENIKLPAYFPFKIKKESVNIVQGQPEEANFFFGSNGEQFINVDLKYTPKGVSYSSPNIIKLDNGTTAYWTVNKNASLIRWFDQDAGIDYGVSIIVVKGENPYSKEDLLKVANSMH